jgi:uncharacterized protein
VKKSGAADLPLHYGSVPPWLYERMSKLGLAIVEALIAEYGKHEVLRRLSDPFWFQSFGAVMGMDWHSSGITTSVMGALKRAVNPLSKELGIYICGGKGKFSKETPNELLRIGERTGVNAHELIRSSKLSAKVDNTAVQDGFQLYTHNFILSDDGQWTIVQQGMNSESRFARRYHWHSEGLTSFVDDPHTGICGPHQGEILNLADHRADQSRNSIMGMTKESPEKIMRETQKLVLPAHHDVRDSDVNLKRLGAMLWLAHDKKPADFEELLLLEGLGPRTLQSLALVSEVIYGTPARFKDPARYSFAHGGKDGHPFPVPVNIYDQTIAVLQTAIHKAKIGESEKKDAIKALTKIAQKAEKDFTPTQSVRKVIEKERKDSWKYGGRTVFGKSLPPDKGQLDLFDNAE